MIFHCALNDRWTVIGEKGDFWPNPSKSQCFSIGPFLHCAKKDRSSLSKEPLFNFDCLRVSSYQVNFQKKTETGLRLLRNTTAKSKEKANQLLNLFLFFSAIDLI